MSQSGFEVFNTVLEMWEIMVQAILFLVLWTAVFGVHKGKKEGMAAVLFLLVNVMTGMLPASWIRYGSSIVLVLGYCRVRLRAYYGKACFVMLAFYNFHSLSFLAANSIYMEMTNESIKSLDALQETYQQQVNRCMAAGLSLAVFIYTIIFVAMAVIASRLLKGAVLMAWQDVVLLSVLNVVGSMFVRVVSGLLIVRIVNGTFVLFDEQPDLLWKIPLIAALIFAGEAALIYFWQRYRILLAKQQKHFVEEQQVRAMKERLKEAENFYGSIRKVRHEMKNHMTNIKGLAETGQYDEVEAYIKKMDETMQELEYQYTTGNAVTDVIINDKCRRAQKAGICFEADFWYGGEIPVFDLGIILNNLLDNAIEACEKLETGEGYIYLTLKRRKKFLLLEVKNSFNGDAPMYSENSLPPTTKRSPLPEIVTEHGIGLENVRDMARRYFGGVNIKVKENMFHVTVMLQQKKKEAEEKK